MADLNMINKYGIPYLQLHLPRIVESECEGKVIRVLLGRQLPQQIRLFFSVAQKNNLKLCYLLGGNVCWDLIIVVKGNIYFHKIFILIWLLFLLQGEINFTRSSQFYRYLGMILIFFKFWSLYSSIRLAYNKQPPVFICSPGILPQ